MIADAKTLALCERFYSIQGESSFAGLPCLFIRLSGCNLRCRWCDSSYSFGAGEHCPLDEMTAWALAHRCRLVELTGGEPLLQEEAYELVNALLAGGKKVLIETNGSVDISRVPVAAHVIMDVKCPGSGMADRFCAKNLAHLARRKTAGATDEIKFVLADEADFHWALAFISEHQLAGVVPLLFSPVRPGLEPVRLAELMLAHHAPARLQLQLHALLWPGKSGV